jgi:hypothetical protein
VLDMGRVIANFICTFAKLRFAKENEQKKNFSFAHLITRPQSRHAKKKIFLIWLRFPAAQTSFDCGNDRCRGHLLFVIFASE